jgi:hypothetical protein
MHILGKTGLVETNNGRERNTRFPLLDGAADSMSTRGPRVMFVFQRGSQGFA